VLSAHGVGTRADLPLPTGYVIAGGTVAVAVSFVALGLLWRESRLRGEASGRPTPTLVQRFADSNVVTALLRLATLIVFGVVIAAAFAGPAAVPRNVAPWAFYVTFWVGLAVVSLLLGPVWRRLNPLRLVHRCLRPIVGAGREPELLDRLGMWPAAGSLAAFAWLELASPDRSDPRQIGTFLVVYAAVHLLGACWFGERWFAHGDGFEVYSTLLGRLSVFGRDTDGHVVVRSPLNNADGQPPTRGLVAVVVVLVGSTAFDGLTRTLWWQNGLGSVGEKDTTALGLGLAISVTAVAVGFAVTAGLAGRLGGYADPARLLAHSLIPIAAGYAIAHYFSLLVFDGQTTYILASDPFGTGANWFGTSGKVVDYTVVSTRTISLVQVVSIVAGHVLGVMLSHDRAVRLSRKHQLVSQLPLLVLMVGLTLLALVVLLGG
jgi:hypothetical protein